MKSTSSIWIKNLVTLALFLVPVVPLIVASQFFFPFITGKAFYFRILVELAFAGWLILAFLDAKYRPRLTPLTIAVTIFTVIVLIADIFGVNPARSIWSNFERMEGWITIVHLWAFFLVLDGVFGSGEHGRKMWLRWINTTLSIATIVGIYGLFQMFGWAEIHQGSTRIDASLGNAAYMAVYMLIHTFIAAYAYFISKQRTSSGMTWIYGALSIFFGFLVFQTATRGTILGLIGGVFLALVIYTIFGRKEPKKSRQWAMGFIGLMLLVSGIFWLNRDAEFIRSSEVLNRIASISWAENKTQARGYIWPMAINGALDRPILGWGQENFNYIFNGNYNPKMWNQEQWFDRAHSVFLDWLVAAGFLGLISYLSLYALSLLAIWKSHLSLAEKSALIGLLAAYAVHNIFVFDNLASYFLFFAVLAFTNSLTRDNSRVLAEKSEISPDSIRYFVAPAVVVLLVAGLYYVNIRPIRANTGLIDALQACASGQPKIELFEKVLDLNTRVADQEAREQALACTGNVINDSRYPLSLKQEFFTFGQREINNQIAESPDDARIYTLAGYFLAVIGDLEQSGKFLEKALELSPNKQSTALQLATIYINTNRIQEALDLFKKTYELDTTHVVAKEAYARALIASGREAEARAQFAKTDPKFFESDVVADIYLALNQPAKAVPIYEKLSAADPANADLKMKLADALAQAGQRTRAINILNQLAKDRPDLKLQVDEALKAINK